ncbi:serine hydrolase domain-containing protein [Rhizobium sp. S96]|uniref:serine hydrolase domain-containing protein n=1 Tax=Rhizobium sp. S96 TaxID=3055140 RepID=UPI0025AB235E|nr:serine hydrolase domain-containing protein [Rhizobium sp. S96]MDM9622897.1 serine hydrolase domain-containing protein [Rhizobium sp. S96]
MIGIRRSFVRVLALTVCVALLTSAPAIQAFRTDDMHRSLEFLAIKAPNGVGQTLDLYEAMQALRIQTASIALIDGGEIAWTEAIGSECAEPIYQAASLSKLVTAVVALRLVDKGVLSLDAPVDGIQKRWTSARPPITDGLPVTLRLLLSMRAGINVPSFRGYAIGSSLPTLPQILDGTPPANSPPVAVVAQPGNQYAYSGGGYEVVEALIEDATRRRFADVAAEQVLNPLGMASSTFSYPLPPALLQCVARGHTANGQEISGGWRVTPELAAAGLWSTPSDLAKLLIAITDVYQARSRFLNPDTVEAMLERVGDGPYGLGAAVHGAGDDVVLMKRGHNVGYQSYLLMFPARGQGIVVMTDSDRGFVLANALVRRAAEVYSWPAVGALAN